MVTNPSKLQWVSILRMWFFQLMALGLRAAQSSQTCYYFFSSANKVRNTVWASCFSASSLLSISCPSTASVTWQRDCGSLLQLLVPHFAFLSETQASKRDGLLTILQSETKNAKRNQDEILMKTQLYLYHNSISHSVLASSSLLFQPLALLLSPSSLSLPPSPPPPPPPFLHPLSTPQSQQPVLALAIRASSLLCPSPLEVPLQSSIIASSPPGSASLMTLPASLKRVVAAQHFALCHARALTGDS